MIGNEEMKSLEAESHGQVAPSLLMEKGTAWHLQLAPAAGTCNMLIYTIII